MAGASPRTSRMDRNPCRPSAAVSHTSFCELFLEDPSPTMKAGHDRPDRNVEDLSRVLVREIADVDEDDDVPEVVRHLGKGLDDLVLGEALDDPRLVVGARVRFEPVVEEVVPFLEGLGRRRALLTAAAVDVQVREDPEEPGAEVRARRVGAPAAESP